MLLSPVMKSVFSFGLGMAIPWEVYLLPAPTVFVVALLYNGVITAVFKVIEPC